MRHTRTILLTLGVSLLSTSVGYAQTPFEPGATPLTLTRPEDSTALAARHDSAQVKAARDNAEKAARDSALRTGSVESVGVLRTDEVIVSRVKQGGPGCPLSRSQVAAVRTGVGAGFIAGNAYLYHYFKQAWWSGERAPHFFFHADWDQWFRDQDKFGHMLGGYHLARIGYLAMREACVSDKKAIIWSAAYAAAFQVQIEIFDGKFKKYGFSYADVIANTTGQTLAVMQELHPAFRAIKPTFSYHKTSALRNTENGTIQSELRPSLDYSGQTYWFSGDMSKLLPESVGQHWPAFVRLSVGHSVTDWIRPNDAAVIRGKRKLLLSLDLDPDKLPGDAPLWRTVKRTLSYYHFPAPALQITPRLHLDPWYR